MNLRKAKSQRGLSLIEVTIMLLVLMLLTSVLAPSIFDFVQDAQWVKVKEDCEVLAITVARLIKDVGPRLIDEPGGRYPEEKLDLIVSDGRPALEAPPGVSGFGDGRVNWWTINDNANPVAEDGISTCDEQFITNEYGGAKFYREATGPGFGLAWGQGWRGAYLSPPCGPDPWGYAYQINVKWLTTTFDTGGRTHDRKERLHCNDVFCISPGKNGIIETRFGYSYDRPHGGIFRRGDDWVTIIAPCDP
jgi:type II secretory pathway pseudopilin PulG